MEHGIKKNILLIGYDSNIGLGVLFCLRLLGCDFYLLTHNSRNAARYSRFIKKSFLYHAEKDNLTDKIIELAERYKMDLIMPYDELETREVTKNKEVLSRYAPCLLGTDPAYFDIGIHKLKLAEFLTEKGIPCPAFATYDNKVQLEKLIDLAGFPLLSKPVRQSAGRNIQKFHDRESLQAFFVERPDAQRDFILQPFIIGSDVTCNVICRGGEIICYTIQESPVKTGSNFSTNDTLEYHNDNEVIGVVGNMMKELHWNGVACVDMRRDAQTRKVYVLEINGRFWASVVPSFLKAGVNFPLILFKLSLGEQVEIPKMRPARQVSFKEYLRSLFTGGKLKFRDTKYESYLYDPIARFIQVFIK
ncbi:MAG TPA: ATP-grasp domain-containing protein [Sediminibacterium sp.]|nr:ATP-grasp domain-containing protein [Sediminibacterium sp.]